MADGLRLVVRSLHLGRRVAENSPIMPIKRLISCRVTALALAGAIAALSVRLPLPRPVEKVSDEDFPCKYHACGCVDAEMCRTRCCCFKPKTTGAERGQASCCSRRAPSPADPARTPRPAIQSPECAGVNYVLLAHGAVLSQPEATGLVRLTLDPGDRLTLAGSTPPDDRALTPPHPPPRA
jgi:hypothetical protein